MVNVLHSNPLFRQAPRILSAGIVLVSLVAFGLVASQAVGASNTLSQVRLTPFAAAIVLQLVALVFLMFAWERLLAILWGNRHDSLTGIKPSLFTAYSRSWLARYIPGRIWALGGRVILASRVGASAHEVARSMAFEVLFSYSLVTIIGAALIVTARVHPVAGAAVLAVGLGLFAVGVPLIQRLMGQVNQSANPESLIRKLGRRTQRFIVGANSLTGQNMVWATTIYGIYSVLQLLFIVLIATSFVDLTLSQALVVAGAWGLSVTLGWLSFLAPVGLGVRDGLAFVFFTQVMDAPTASLIVAASRIVMVGADLVFVGLVEMLALGMNARQTQPQTLS